MSERWRKPLTIFDISPHDTELIELADGRVQRNNVMTFDRDGQRAHIHH